MGDCFGLAAGGAGGAGAGVGAGRMGGHCDAKAELIGCWGEGMCACLAAWKHGIDQHSQDGASAEGGERSDESICIKWSNLTERALVAAIDRQRARQVPC